MKEVSERVTRAIPSIETSGPFLTREEVCARLGFSYPTIWKMMQKSENPFPRALKIGESVRWVAAEVDSWVLSHARMRVKGDDPAHDARYHNRSEIGRKGAAVRHAKRKLVTGKAREQEARR